MKLISNPHKMLKAFLGLQFVVAILLLSPSISNAQGIMVGARGNISMTGMSAPKAGFKFSQGVGFTGGVLLNVASSDLFSIQPEWNYSFSSMEAKGTKLKLSYSQIPILFKLSKGSNLRWFVNGGPAINLLMEAKEEGSIAISDGSLAPQENLNRSVKNTLDAYNVSLLFGGGVIVKNILVELRYNLGLSDIAPNDSNYIYRTRGLELSIGYVLFL
ncbi:porin family protein [Sediminitomix flava]|uniref:Outer membrane protein with beta-barrel domain n=1 Tax=Sediminitomix flava TaxID=379075 RepID=A0A315ZAM8_SEDFL|nr:porin family protein [Sediminitomix flava]PWJ42601.1 outer membrane protein with beta-barrel domain [Sediminitomix flava]